MHTLIFLLIPFKIFLTWEKILDPPLLLLLTSFAPIPHFSSTSLLARNSDCPFFKLLVHQVNAVNHHDHQPAELRWPRERGNSPRKRTAVAIPSHPRRVVDGKDVTVLTSSNFTDFVVRNPYVVLNFYAPWCYWSNRLAPEYAAAATLLKGEAVVAKIDATVERHLARKYRIRHYPTIILFVGGVQNTVYCADFGRTRNAITSWVRQNIRDQELRGLLLPDQQVLVNNNEDSSWLDKQVLVNSFKQDEEKSLNKATEDVVVLTNQNFSDFISRNHFVMVNFYASWCYWSKQLAPEYAAAATMLKGEVVLAKVEASLENVLRKEYDIQGYPTMLLFVGAEAQGHPYYGDRSRDAIASWLRQQKGGIVQTLTATEDFRPKTMMVLGILDNLEGPEGRELAAAAKLHPDVGFYQTDNIDVARIFSIDQHVKHPALVILKEETGDHTHIYFDGIFTRSAIAHFVLRHKQASMITFAEEGASYVFESPMRKLFLFAPKDSWEVISTFREMEKTFRGKLLFIFVPNDVGVKLAHRFGVYLDNPKVVAYNGNGNTKKFIYEGVLAFSSIKSFVEKFLNDEFSGQSFPTSVDVFESDAASIQHATNNISQNDQVARKNLSEIVIA